MCFLGINVPSTFPHQSLDTNPERREMDKAWHSGLTHTDNSAKIGRCTPCSISLEITS